MTDEQRDMILLALARWLQRQESVGATMSPPCCIACLGSLWRVNAWGVWDREEHHADNCPMRGGGE